MWGRDGVRSLVDDVDVCSQWMQRVCGRTEVVSLFSCIAIGICSTGLLDVWVWAGKST